MKKTDIKTRTNDTRHSSTSTTVIGRLMEDCTSLRFRGWEPPSGKSLVGRQGTAFLHRRSSTVAHSVTPSIANTSVNYPAPGHGMTEIPPSAVIATPSAYDENLGRKRYHFGVWSPCLVDGGLLKAAGDRLVRTARVPGTKGRDLPREAT
ncbi:unnamed protein product [Soboliphyme baturini]|uniref:Uncharacterized protein n=1 Tax=Soboliphyme baturini TaxID=241478 RepID=A0A183J892_9BILA|nr:unnamed protein product [Soboliphyme baturini]